MFSLNELLKMATGFDFSKNTSGFILNLCMGAGLKASGSSRKILPVVIIQSEKVRKK